MSETRVEVCDKCGTVYDPTACFANGHDLMPCPLCHLKWEMDRKYAAEFLSIHNDRKSVQELLEQIADLQEQIEELQEELDE